MKLTFTEQDLIRYHYGEANQEESQAIQAELERNLNLRLQFERLKFVWDQLDQFKIDPRDRKSVV